MFSKTIAPLIAATSLASCATSSAPTISVPRATEVIANAAVVTSRSKMRQYANLFKSACLDQSPGFANTDDLLTKSGFRRVSGSDASTGNRGSAYTDGTAYASLVVSSRSNNVCSVAVKTNDDDPLVADLKRVVAASQFASGRFSAGGLFGASFVVQRGSKPGHIIAVGRQQRSAQSPTSFSLIDFR